MTDIQSPQHDVDQDLRAMDCLEAVEIAFHQLIADAESKGWRPAEIALALADIAEDYVLMLASGRASRH